jgi:hypothetical protein
MKPRFSVWIRKNSEAQIRDSAKLCERGEQGIVAVFPVLGAGYTTWQTTKQGHRLARRICKMLNNPRCTALVRSGKNPKDWWR